MVHLHWHAPRDNGARITCYVMRGKQVGGIWQERYSGGADSYVDAEVEGGNKYMYEVRAINSCGKSNFSQAFTVSVPLVVDPNAKIDVSEELRKGHLWLECWDQRDERNFWFHTITGEGGEHEQSEFLRGLVFQYIVTKPDSVVAMYLLQATGS